MSGDLQMRQSMDIIIERLANEPHDTIPGLKRRYYWRGAFVLAEHLTPRGLAANVARLRRRGENEHADLLAETWNAAGAVRDAGRGRR